MLDVIAIIVGLAGTVAGAFSARYWLSAAKLPPVYPRAVLSGPTREDKESVDSAAELNAKAARCAAAAILCQALVLAIQSIATAGLV